MFFSKIYYLYKNTSHNVCVIYSYIHERETYTNTKFYVVHSLKYSVQLDTIQYL
jgi:hypothetical protein